MSARSRPKLHTVPAADEQALLAAYRKMDNRARCNTLRIALRHADDWPASNQPGARRSVMVSTEADEQAVLRNLRSMSVDARGFVCRTAAAIAQDFAARSEQPLLRLVVGGRS
jgi:catalase (peroxidase I)